MRRLITVAFLYALLAVPAALSAAVQTPRLQLLDRDVPTVHGMGFKPGEHVRVTMVVGADRATKQTLANRAGSFTMSLTGVSTSSCQGFSITAVGNEGDRTTYKRAPGMCALP